MPRACCCSTKATWPGAVRWATLWPTASASRQALRWRKLYSDASQAGLRQQLTQIYDQIDLLQRSQNTTSQLESLRKDRSAALYDLMDALDAADYEDTDAQTEDYLLAQNKLWIITGDAASFSDQIAALVQQASKVQAQLGSPTQITAPQTGYFVRSASSGRLNAGMEDILALGAADLKAYIESSPEIKLDGCAGKIVSGFTWYYAGICSAKQGEKLLGWDGKPRKTSVEIRFPGQAETPLKATVQEVNIDTENDMTRFVLSCEVINGDVLRLNRANAQVIVGQSTGLRVPQAAVQYLKEDGSEAEGQGENYIPGVYVKYGNLARFCKIDPVDDQHPRCWMAIISSFCPAERPVRSVRFGFMTRLSSPDKICMTENFCSY